MCGIRTSSRTRSGFVSPDERKHLRPGLGLADDLESAVVFERPADPVEDEPMVVGDHDSHPESVAQARDDAASSGVTVAPALDSVAGFQPPRPVEVAPFRVARSA